MSPPRQAEELGQQSIGPVPLDGGLNLADAGSIGPTESAHSINFRHRNGVLEVRENLKHWVDFAAVEKATTRVNSLGLAQFENGNTFVTAHSKDFFWSVAGTTVALRGSVPALTGGLTVGSTELDAWTNQMALNHYFASNGKNNIIEWDGVAATSQALLAVPGYVGGPTGVFAARYLASFAGRLIVAHTLEGVAPGTPHPNRVRWCADSDYLTWAATGTGAGARDLLETPGIITGLTTYGQSLYVLKEDAIFIGQETGDPNLPIVFPTALKVGCLSGQSVQPIGPNTLIFLGRDNFYTLSGSSTQPVGDRVCKNDLGALVELNHGYTRQIVSAINPALGLYFCFLPTSASLSPILGAVRAYIYNYREDRWWIEDYPSEVHAAATLRTTPLAKTWGTLVGTWAQQAGTWGSLGSGFDKFLVLMATQFQTGDYRVHQLTSDSTVEDQAGGGGATAAVTRSRITYPNPSGDAILEGFWLDLFDVEVPNVGFGLASGIYFTATERISNFVVTIAIDQGNTIYWVPLRTSGQRFQIEILLVGRAKIRSIRPVWTNMRSR